MQIQGMRPAPVEKRAVNSNAFSRLSGETERLKPVTIPTASIEKVRNVSLVPDENPGSPEKLFAIGSWAFVLACMGAAVIGLLRIKKLTRSQ